MEEKKKAVIIAEAENVEAIRDFFTEWWTVEELYETLAKVSTTILYLVNKGALTDDEKELFTNLLSQHQIMIDTMKPFARKEGEV